MKKIIVSIFALIAAVSAEAAFVIKHADGTDGGSLTTLTAAFKSANLKDGDTIRVTANWSVAAKRVGAAELNDASKTITIDLAGSSICWSSNDSTLIPLLEVKSGTVIIVDSSEGKTGKVTTNKERPPMIVSGGKLVLQSGIFDGEQHCCVEVKGGELVIDGGSYTCSGSAKYYFKTSDIVDAATITINDGDYQPCESTVSVIEPNDKLTVNITGGKFGVAVGATITELTGGLFANKDDERLADNADSTTKTAYPWTGSTAVVDPVCRETKGGREYATIEDANGNLADGDIIELLKDVKLSDGFALRQGIAVTFDLNGHTVETVGSTAFVAAHEDGSLTLRDSVGTGKIISQSANGAVLCGAGTLVLENVEIENVGGYEGVRVDGSAQVIIQGGSITGGSNVGTVSYAVTLVGTDAQLTISGGTISSTKRGIRVGSGNQLLVSGGLIEAPIGIQLDSGYKTPFILLSGGTIRSSTTALYVQEGTSSIIMNGTTLESPEMAIKIGTASSLLSICSGAIKSETICDVAEENADEYRKFIMGGYYSVKPATGYIKKGYQAIANTDENKADYPWKVVAKATTEETGVTEIKLPETFSGKLTIPATMNAVKVPENTTLEVIGSSGAVITDYVTTAADESGVIAIDLDPAKVETPTLNEVKFEGEGDEKPGIAIPESTPGLTYQLLGGSSLDQIVDIHDEKTGNGAALSFAPDAAKLEGASSAFFRVRVVK